MRVSQQGIDLIKEHEGLELKAYLDSVNVPTIGYGLTRYPNGIKVKLGDEITLQEAEDMLLTTVDRFSMRVNDLIIQPLKPHQFDALVSLAYNIGLGAFEKSTIRKKVNQNPNDPSIRNEFLRWNKAGGKVLKGLTNRRTKEAAYYFNDIT